jgi:hypothetical protein
MANVYLLILTYPRQSNRTPSSRCIGSCGQARMLQRDTVAISQVGAGINIDVHREVALKNLDISPTVYTWKVRPQTSGEFVLVAPLRDIRRQSSRSPVASRWVFSPRSPQHRKISQQHGTAVSSSARSCRVGACHKDLLTDSDSCISTVFPLPKTDLPSSLVR